nr:MAG TPA: holin [Caudoviricetes sp.]
MFENLDLTLFYYIGAIALVMTANTLFGIAKAQKYDEFDWIILKKGMIKYLLILLGVTFVFGAGTLLPEFKVTLPVIEENVTIVQMLSVVSIAILIKYTISCYENLVELFGVQEEIKKTVAEKQKDEFLG